jgi:hypothetical protein
MATKTERKNPGLFEILFGASLSVVLGALLAFMHLVFRPVEMVSVVPKEPTAGVRYCIQGANGSSSGPRWKIKVQRLADKIPGEFMFSEGDLNAWAESTFQKAGAPAAPATPAAAAAAQAAAPSFALVSGVPNFKITGGKLQIASINDLFLLGGVSKLVVEAKGTFVKGAEGWDFVPSEFFLGGLPTRKLPMLTSFLVSRFSKSKAASPELANVMARASAITIEGSSLVVKVP